MKPHPWYAGAVNKAELSGGDYEPPPACRKADAPITSSTPRPGGKLYVLDSCQSGTNDPKLDYQINDADWVPVYFSDKIDLINIANDSKPDLRFIAWIKVGPVNLQAGQNTIAFKFHSANNNHGSLDCFLFTQAPFTPSGKLKPDKSSAPMNRAGGPSSARAGNFRQRSPFA